MKRLVLATFLTFVMTLTSPLLPHVSAASVQDVLLANVQQNVNLSKVQDLLKLKQDFEAGNKAAVINAVVNNALKSTGNLAVTSALASGNLAQAVEAVTKQGLEQKVTASLAPYQKELNILLALLNGNNVLTPQAVKDNNSLIGAPQNYKKVIDMTATAYGPGIIDNGKWDKLTYMGGTVRKGVAAVDPSVIPMGSKLWVEGYGFAIAEDQGSAIKGNRIDLAFDTRQEALDYGIQKAKIYILN